MAVKNVNRQQTISRIEATDVLRNATLFSSHNLYSILEKLFYTLTQLVFSRLVLSVDKEVLKLLKQLLRPEPNSAVYCPVKTPDEKTTGHTLPEVFN